MVHQSRNGKRNARIEQLVRGIFSSDGGAPPPDYASIENAHPDLKPELGECLSLIEAIDRAAASPPPFNQTREDADLEFISESLPAYEIIEVVDYGGQGRVYRAVQKATNRSVAIKVLLDGPFANRRRHGRFLREISLVSRLNHPGIVTVYDSGSIQGRPYLVMEFVEGLPIDDHALADDFNLRQRIELFLEACGAVSAAHAKGIVHRDLKPANIMVDSEGRVRLLDFGLAKDLSPDPDDDPHSALSLSGHRVGTARYSSPEQIGGGHPVDVRSDIYALGVVLFELITGTMPYVQSDRIYSDVDLIMSGERFDLRQALKKFPGHSCITPRHVKRDLEMIVHNAMAEDPVRRYATVDEFAQDLRSYLCRRPIKVRHGIAYRLQSKLKAYRVRFAVAAVIAVMATASTIGMMAWHSARESERRTQEVARIAQIGLSMGSFVRQSRVNLDASDLNAAIDMLLQVVELSKHVPTYDPLVRRQVYQAHHNLADYYFKANRPEEANRHCDKAIELSDAFQQEDPNDLEWIRLGSYSHRLSGRAAYVRGETDEALRHFESMLALREDLAEREPDVLHRKLELADAHKWIAKAARQGNQFDKAVRHHSMECSILTDVLNAEPEMAGYARRLSQSETMLGVAQMEYKTSDGDGRALKSFRQARRRMVVLQGSTATENHEKQIVDLLDSIDRNLAIVNRRIERSTGDQIP